MTRTTLGIVCGVVFGIVDVLLMIPLHFEDRTAALTAAFASRFAIGFFIGSSDQRLPSWANGLIVGLLISLPDAIITKAFAPIMMSGAIGGVVIGLIVGKWGNPKNQDQSADAESRLQ